MKKLNFTTKTAIALWFVVFHLTLSAYEIWGLMETKVSTAGN